MARKKRMAVPCLTCERNFGCLLKLERMKRHEESAECPIYLKNTEKEHVQ